MPIMRQIQYVGRSFRSGPHERIMSVGGATPDGSVWKVSLQEAVQMAESRRYEFYIVNGRSRVDVLVATTPYGHKYLKAKTDRDQPDTLLGLPDFP